MLSQFIQRALAPVFGGAVRLHRVRSATRLLMRHIGLNGRCDCMRTHDERGRRGVLLRIETGQRVPLAERPQFQAYFQRKLFELGVLSERDRGAVQLVLFDADDLAGAASAPPHHVSSRRVAGIVRGANPGGAAELAHGQRVVQLREHLSARRRARLATDFSPLQAASLTELSPLGES